MRAVQILRPHQVEGVRWLFGAFGRGGGLLTDEPGLGKTLQLIALLEALIRARALARVLVVAPANLCAHSTLKPCRDPHARSNFVICATDVIQLGSHSSQLL